MMSPVVVGVDGSPASLLAAAWAGKEAALRRTRLIVVHAVPPVPAVERPVPSGVREMLEEATLRARAGQPRLDLTVDVVAGSPVPALAERAADALLLVVGRRGQGGLGGWQLGSVSAGLVCSAPCPVVVVGHHRHERTGEVVVGVSGRPDQEAVLEFAFLEASARAATLRAVHTWSRSDPHRPARSDAAVPEPVLEQEENVLLAEALAGWQEKFPEVEVRRACGRGLPGPTLVAASAEADVLVAGLRARDLTGRMPGSTTHALLHHAQCPVAVVRHR